MLPVIMYNDVSSKCLHSTDVHAVSQHSASSRLVYRFAVPDYFRWGYVGRKVQETRPANWRLKETRISGCIQSILKEILQRVMTYFPSQLQKGIEQHGDHLLNVTIKQ
jgi:hypothetical protein